MTMNDKHTSIQQDKLARQFAELEPKCIFAAEGNISGLDGKLRILLRVYDNEKYDKHNYPATMSIKKRGAFINNVFGEVVGLKNPKMPILFSCHVQSYNEGLVDMVKMYKNGDEIEGKVYPVGLSVMWKECMAGNKPYSDERKREVNKLRNENAYHFKAQIIPEHTLVNVPDNKKPQHPKSERSHKPAPK
jgi:hypothetical protein